MPVYTCTKFSGYYPVGTAAVVQALSPADAADFLNQELTARGLMPGVTAEHMEEFTGQPLVKILCDGNY